MWPSRRVRIWIVPWRPPIRAFLDAVTEVSNRQLVSQPQSPDFHLFTVNPSAVSAAEVAYDNFTVILGQGAMATRQPE
jgi:hypothetical protein